MSTHPQAPDLLLRSPWGTLAAWHSEAGLARLDYDWRGPAPAALFACSGRAAVLRDALNSYFAGEPVTFDAVTLDLSAGTPFQQEVWRAICAIPWGDTWTYGAVARRVGKPGAARAIGQAMGANPIPIVVPCHRVIGVNGLGGYTGGLEWKRRLLSLEGASIPGKGTSC